ncbi:MAG TPA: ABC transporter ATP-binding protein [Anaerolineae bacterium]|nr:ABC transporter ATP-binding protein [Anaerolineae bacterium]HQM14796.1 ABC transporter ATP-binding protein [Anaerolineae bacterium]
MGALEIQGLAKRFGNHVVLENLDLSVAEGEFFVLLGPSGGGKSTILKLICGIETPDAGRVILNGHDITDLPPRSRNVGMVFQDYGLYPHMNVFENIAYGLEARGMRKDEVRQRVKEAADKLGLTPLIDRVIVDLSGGEQQRVALARALAKDADLYLFDEPLSNLDPKLRTQARRDIVMVHRAKRKPSLYVTHDQTEALAIGDRIAIIARGKLQQVGTADDLIQRPANMFVAGFIGAPPMNLLRGALLTEKGAFRVDVCPGVSVPLPEEWNLALEKFGKKQVVLGIPPAAFLAPDAVADESRGPINFIEGEIDWVEPLINEVIVSFKLAEGIYAHALFTNLDETLFSRGNRLKVGLDSGQFCLFDPDTEQAIWHEKFWF